MHNVVVAISELVERVRANSHNHLLKLWTPELHTEVLVSPQGGTEHLIGWRNSTEFWFNLKLPSNLPAHFPIKFNLFDHAEGIGASGWNYVTKQSLWTTFDIDSIEDHRPEIAVNDDNLNLVIEYVSKLSYVEIRRSTSGCGIHLRVYLNAITSESLAEHHSHSTRVLKRITQDSGITLTDYIDVHGQNFWLWNRRCNERSFALIKPADGKLSLSL